jgi:hypothetical protein
VPSSIRVQPCVVIAPAGRIPAIAQIAPARHRIALVILALPSFDWNRVYGAAFVAPRERE